MSDFKNKEVSELWKRFQKEMKEASIPYYNSNIDEFSQFINAYKLRIEQLRELDIEDIASYARLREFNGSILDLLLKSKDAIVNYHFKNIAGELPLQLEDLLKNTPHVLRRKEEFDGYLLNNKTNLPLFFNKLAINIKHSLVKGKKKFYNFFRKIFKKKALDLKTFRRRKIPYASMIQFYLGSQFHVNMLPVLEELMLAKSKILLGIWKFDEALEEHLQNSLHEKEFKELSKLLGQNDFNELYHTQEKMINELKTHVDSIIEQTILNSFIELDEAIIRVDTPDLPAPKFKNSLLEEKKVEVIADYNKRLEKWENTHKTLFDDWTVDVELMHLYFSVLVDFSELHSKIGEYITNNLSVNLDALREFIRASSEIINKKSNTAKELKQVLKEERDQNASEFVDKLLAKTIHRLSGNINNDILAFKTKNMNLVSQISDKRGFIKNKNYERGIKTNEISWLSPRDLINFEALPHFNESIEEVEQFVHHHLEKARIKLLALGTVSDFSLESAQIMLENKKGGPKNSLQVVVDGYGRALTHLDEASELMDKIKVEPLEDLQLAINTFNAEIQKLKNTENVLELNMKIVKIRAIERSKKMREEAWQWILHFLPKSILFFKTQFANTIIQINDVKMKLGLLTEKSHISHELSDFLKKTELSLKKLPFVYQRLYQLTPTNEDRFFVGRSMELEQLQNAYAEWQKGRFITTAIIGEKGSGITSLLLFFLKKNEIDIPILHKEIGLKIFEHQSYYQFFAELFKQERFKTNDEIIKYLNNKKGQQIIILENIQHLYLKKVNGFNCQKMFFDLIASTSKKVFWISTYTTHSWEYLEKTLKISAIFTREVYLEKLSELTIEEIIFKRNYLSGYHVDFEAPETIFTSKSFLKLNDQEKQEFLRKSFFKDLTQMSNGNVSLAQLYWLRSTHGVTDDTLNIISLRDFDVSFDKELPANYLFALHAILVHDGLTIEDYAQVFQLPEYICRNDLIPMLEKGLLMKPREKYNINPIIFKQVVDLLRSHNFIN